MALKKKKEEEEEASLSSIKKFMHSTNTLNTIIILKCMVNEQVLVN